MEEISELEHLIGKEVKVVTVHRHDGMKEKNLVCRGFFKDGIEIYCSQSKEGYRKPVTFAGTDEGILRIEHDGEVVYENQGVEEDYLGRGTPIRNPRDQDRIRSRGTWYLELPDEHAFELTG